VAATSAAEMTATAVLRKRSLRRESEGYCGYGSQYEVNQRPAA
jgi:hypothetical protein